MRKILLIQGFLAAFFVTACTDYVQQMDEIYELKVQQAAAESSSSKETVSEGKEGEVMSSSLVVQSSSDEAVLAISSSNTEPDVIVEISSSSAFENVPEDSVDDDTVTLKRLPVMMFDWLHGNQGDGEKGNGNPEYGVSADFGSGGCSGSPMRGMVEQHLGPNGVPVKAALFPSNCKITDHLDYWFIPESLAVDAQGKTLTNMTCRDLYISLDSAGYWLAEISKNAVSQGNEANRGGMFLLDDFQYLDSAKIIPNPYYDQLRGGADNTNHNFGFAMKIQATFVYQPGQYFDFLGDDDVWVFINNRLAVDIGGQHAQVAGAVDLDTLGLVPGETYPFHIFYAERHTSSSNFRMHTSINLKADPNFLCH